VNVAEEVKNPERNVPRAVLLSLGIAGVIYILVAWLALKL
jgi:amino acid transporter